MLILIITQTTKNQLFTILLKNGKSPAFTGLFLAWNSLIRLV